jgi:hypothetical protein
MKAIRNVQVLCLRRANSVRVLVELAIFETWLQCVYDLGLWVRTSWTCASRFCSHDSLVRILECCFTYICTSLLLLNTSCTALCQRFTSRGPSVHIAQTFKVDIWPIGHIS